MALEELKDKPHDVPSEVSMREKIEEWLADIAWGAGVGDSETAHEAEDELWAMVLKEIAEHPEHPDVGEWAKLALASREIVFHRWYA